MYVEKVIPSHNGDDLKTHHGDCNYVSMSELSFPSVSINSELDVLQRMRCNKRLQRVASGRAVD